MSDIEQYDINPNNWDVVKHLINSGFVPLIHPHGVTESYIFVNKKHGKWIEHIAKPITESIAMNLAKRLLNANDVKDPDHFYPHATSLYNSAFMPLGITGGSIHGSQLSSFRTEFVRRAAMITPAQFDLITS